MGLTKEQQDIVDYVVANEGVTAVSAVAGSGKTHLLVELSKQFLTGTSLYLAYNKSIASEARSKFPSSVSCLTTHSLAYKAIVTPNKFEVAPFINFKSVDDIRSFDYFMEITGAIKDFCLSEHTSLEQFFEYEEYEETARGFIKKYITQMAHGELPCTHEAYLKFFHMSLANGTMTYKEDFEIIMLDEAGDLNPVTLEIFKLLPAKRKIMVGDPHQNIYAFNQTINGFEAMEHKVEKFPMSQSFRVDASIAERVEKFCTTHLEEDFKFKGTELEDKSITTSAYITRTNAALVAKMMELNAIGVQYGLVRSPDKIFEVPLMLCSLKPGKVLSNKNYSHLQDDVEEWYDDKALRMQHKSIYGFLSKKYKEDIALQVAVGLITRNGPKAIFECHEEAKRHTKRTQSLILGTAHSTKGLEFDSVTISHDLNKAAVMAKEAGNKDELNLYYVATTRAKKELINATEL